MATLRFKAWEDVLHRQPKHVTPPSDKISDFYGSMVFNDEAMRKYLSSPVFKAVKKATNTGSRIDRDIADHVASAMKEWAMSKGATHYTHWFQPLTGSTAEKHDAFFTPIEGGRAIEAFRGSMLTQQEPDASSFPNGGLRNTFEARGYTAWDPSSPAFIHSKTLVIPTIFLSYTGESLDNKMPLLKALSLVEKAAIPICQYFDRNVSKVTCTLGWEQEYFLVDKALYNARPDIMMTGRALFGHHPAKGQQLDDHYFGSIPERIVGFMRDFETQALELGIPVTTRHNEVAPNQFEVAPIFEECNLANDHNLLLMDLMEKVARQHDFRVLLHEKPFAGLNGSGKHNNWSLATDSGVNLLQPGHNPKSNLQFLTFFINTIKAIHDYADILRASIASAGNDHRLGANEAPPAIISAFIGSQLTKTLDNLEKSITAGKMTPEAKTALKLNIGKIPEILLDNTDRNRTSPFAFTGNKFEFRAVGSSANCAVPMAVLNTIMANQLIQFHKEVEASIKKGVKKDEAILRVLRDYIIASKKIRFEGNGYGDEWVKEAAKRGLNNVKDTPRALDFMVTKEAEKLYTDMGIFTKEELHARHEIALENYIMKLQIESRVTADIAISQIIPAAISYQSELVDSAMSIQDLLGPKAPCRTQLEMIASIGKLIDELSENAEKMRQERKKANALTDSKKKAVAYCDKVKPLMDTVRDKVDRLELLVDDELWPLPKLRELLFTR
jgi:glutamine synthetase